MGRRGNGEGSIALHKSGAYMYRWTDPDGRRRSGYAKTRREAQDRLRDALRRIEDGQPSVETAETFKSVAEKWRRTALVRQGIASSSLRTYSVALKTHAYPVIGDKRMRDLKPSDVAEVLARMEASGLSASYRHVVHKAMSNVCQMAMEDDLMRRNPVRSVKAPRGTKTTKVVPTREQVGQMIEAAEEPRMRALLVVLAYTGLRIGEALSLRWSDWDGAGTLQVHTTKTGKPRAIPVPATLAEELRVWRKAQMAERMASVWWDTDADWMLSTDVGTKWDPSNARKRFVPIANGTPASEGVEEVPGICPGATFHSLRHATATILLEQGVPMRVVSDLLGHSTTRLTADTYSHVTARLVEQASDAIQEALG